MSVKKSEALSMASKRYQKQSENVKKLGTCQTFMTLIKGFVCSGCLILPKSFINGGWVFQIAMLIFSGIYTMYCAKLVLECRQKMNASSYPELGYKAYGKCGKFAVDLALWFSQTGFCFAYVFFVKENFHKVLLQISDNKIDVSTNTFAIGSFFLFTLLCFVRKIEIFASTHTFADLMIVLTMLTVVIYGCKEIKQNGEILVS